METVKYTVLRVRKTTRDMLKLVSALSHESMVETMDRLAQQELARIQQEQEKPDAALYKEEKVGSRRESLACDQASSNGRARGVFS